MRLSQILVTAAALLSLAAAPAFAAEPPPAASVTAAAAPAAAPAAAAAPKAQAEKNEVLKEAGITPEIAQKLSSDQVFEILHRRAMNDGQSKDPTAVPVAFFVFLFLGVSVGLYLGFRRDRERQETLRAMIQRGGTIPPELLVPPTKKFGDLRRGITLVAVGLGLMIFLGVVPTEHGVWTAGLIPMLLGGGYLLTWKLTRAEAGAHTMKDEAAIAAEREVNSL